MTKRKIEVELFSKMVSSSITIEDKLILLSSGIWTFGSRMQVPTAGLPKVLLESILIQLLPHQTLLLPAFTYSFCSNRIYDPAASLPETGVLPISALLELGGIRTKSAINSYIAIGPMAEELKEKTGLSIWGEGSIAELIQINNAKVLSLGLPISLSTGFLHRIEELAGVPYRFYKDFAGKWIESGTERSWSERMYVRSMNAPADLDWNVLTNLLEKNGVINNVEGPLTLQVSKAQDLVENGLSLLANDPLALVRNRDEVEYWIRDVKTSEVRMALE